MIIIHAVQKLLNTSKLKPALFVSAPSPGQLMHSWYAKLLSTGFAGKMLVMYVHEPSLLTVLTKGKTINTTLPQFCERLPRLLAHMGFEPAFITAELHLVQEGYVVSKTSNKSMLGSMNALTLNIEYGCRSFSSYETINLDHIEEIFADWLTKDRSAGGYRSVRNYWQERDLLP